MPSTYEEYKERVRKYMEDNRGLIDKVCRGDVPQHVLWSKAVNAAIEDRIGGDCFTRDADDTFFFTEEMVNRLMYFAYEKGARDIDERSHKRGWADCRESLLRKLEAWKDDSYA